MKSRVADGWLIVGYGSRLRGDDAVGPRAARILSRRGYRALAVDQLSPELAETMAKARAVVFVDADVRVAAGEVEVAPIPAAAARAAVLEHHSTPEALLELARELYGATPEAWRVGIGGADFGLGRPLSAAARRGLRRAVAAIIALSKPDSPPRRAP